MNIVMIDISFKILTFLILKIYSNKVFDEYKNKNKIIEEINTQKYIFQKFLSKARLNSKFTPKINFYLDDSFDEAEKIEKLLLKKDVSRDLDG